jgi:hypothetical protein
MVVTTRAPLAEGKLRPVNGRTDCVSQPEAHMNVQPLILQLATLQVSWRRPGCTHIFRAAPCRIYREAICHAKIQRTQKAKEISTTAASNSVTATAIVTNVIFTATYATPPKAIANAATSSRPQTTMGKIG